MRDYSKCPKTDCYYNRKGICYEDLKYKIGLCDYVDPVKVKEYYDMLEKGREEYRRKYNNVSVSDQNEDTSELSDR